MKSHAWLLAVSFIPFSFLGFLFAQFSLHGMTQPDPVVPTVTILEPRSQTNILFITVDTDAKPNPRLISVWGLFFSTLDENVAEMIPLYPSKDSLKDTVLLSKFFLTQDNHLDQSFLDLAQKAFQLEWDAYIIINQKEVDKLSKQLGMNIKITDSNLTTASPETILLKQLCSVMKSSGMELDLHQILKAHVIDNGCSSSLLASFDQWIKTSKPFSSCEVQQ